MASATQEMGNQDLSGDLMILKKKLSKADLELLVTIFWMIWHGRIKFIFEGLKLDLILSINKDEVVNKAFKRTQFHKKRKRNKNYVLFKPRYV